MYISVDAYIHVYIFVSVYVDIQACAYAHTYMYVVLYLYLYACIHVYTRMPVYMCMVHMYTGIHAHTQCFLKDPERLVKIGSSTM